MTPKSKNISLPALPRRWYNSTVAFVVSDVDDRVASVDVLVCFYMV